MAKEQKPVLGYIKCGHCHEQMGVKHDKNGDPFGHCEFCRGQLRTGGCPSRVRKFVALHPWAARTALSAADPVTVTVTEKTEAPAPVTAPEAPPARRRASFADGLLFMGGKHDA